MNLQKVNQYFYTLKYMKFKQIRYRLFYTLRTRYRKKIGFSYAYEKDVSLSQKINFQKSIPAYPSYDKNSQQDSFTFLNLTHTFDKDIDWNYAELGKLWTYNLTYFEFLLQDEIGVDDGLRLIFDFIENISQVKDGLEPFPIALRGMNWIKFLTLHDISNSQIDKSLYAQYYILMDNLEYHLLGNHLLENGFSLLFGGYYFNDEHLYNKAKEILIQELHEQILEDGAHFELTPMYHQIMLYRVLDCINLVRSNDNFNDANLLGILEEKAASMLGWLQEMTYKNGSIPHVNDSTDGIAPVSSALFAYANRLGITTAVKKLSDSGYRKYVTPRYEFLIDIGNIGPDYIPGHAHSDTFSFELHVDGIPIVKDTGISTYEANERRALERSTKAHNTVMIDEFEQSEVWSSFRVARRAYIISKEENSNKLRATHDGYKRQGILHTRSVLHDKNRIVLTDTLQYKKKSFENAIAYIHFSPDISVKQEKNQIYAQNTIFSFKGLKKLELVDITIAEGYNRLRKTKMAKVYFDETLSTSIDIVEL